MYGESLKRNLLGEYEPGALQILLQIYEKTLEDVIKERLTLRQKQETETEEKKKLERRLEDLKQELGRNGEEPERAFANRPGIRGGAFRAQENFALSGA